MRLTRTARVSKGLTSFSLACTGALAALTATIFSEPASGQTAESTSAVIEEIVVTSRRMEESVQDVPISVSAFTEADIDRIAPRTLRDIDGLMPNVFVGQQTAGPSMGAIFIRGIGAADVEKSVMPSVGLVLDDVFQGTSTGQLIDTFDVAQIEVNRGPQGVLYGKNTTGGTVVVTRHRPQMNEWGWAVAGEAGDYNKQQLKGRLNVPLIDDQLALKVAGVYKERDSYYDNTRTGCSECSTDVDYVALTTALLWEPTENLSALLTYDYIDDTPDLAPQDPRYNGLDPFETEANGREDVDYEVNAISLNIEWDLEWATLVSISAYVDSTDDVTQDFDGSDDLNIAAPLPQLHTLREQEYKQTSQELRLSGQLFGRDDLSYTAGGLYWHTEIDLQQGTNQIVQFGNPIFPAPCALIGLGANPVPSIGDAFCRLPITYTRQNTSVEEDSYAVFGAVNWDITDKLQLSAGARWLYEEKDFETRWGDAVPSGPILPPTQRLNTYAGFPVKVDDDWDKTVFEATATYRLTDMNTVYARYAEGFRSGGFSTRGVDPEFLSYNPETAESYELGSKNDFFDGRLRANLAIFYQEVTSPQGSAIVTIPGNPGTDTIILNGSKIESQGVELELTWAATDSLTFLAQGGYQDVESKESTQSSRTVPFNQPSGTACNPLENPGFFPAAPSINPNSCPNVDFPSQDVSRAPDWNWSVTGVYDAELFGGQFEASATYRAQDDTQLAGSSVGTPEVQSGWDVLDARVAYTYPLQNEDLLRLSLVGKNLTDEEYREQTLQLGSAGGFQQWAPPRTWAVELLWMH